MERGICPVCGYSWAVTKHRILLRHHNDRPPYGNRLCRGVGLKADDDPVAVAFAPAAPLAPTAEEKP